MNFYQTIQIIESLKDNHSIIDLSKGDAYVPDLVKNYLLEQLKTIVNMQDISQIFLYDNYDGLNVFLNKFKKSYESIYNLSCYDYETMVTPGAQTALYYLQILLSKKNKKILYPALFEYSGAFNTLKSQKVSYDLTGFLSGNVNYDKNHLSTINWHEISAIFLSQPHNPTAILWSGERLQQLAEYVLPYNIFLVLDETYALPFAPLTINPPVPLTIKNAIHIYSFSKVGLAGERVGVIVACKEILSSLRHLQRKLLIQTPKIGQLLAYNLIDYFFNQPTVVKDFALTYEERFKVSNQILQNNGLIEELIHLPKWSGGPFLWLESKGNFDEIKFFHKLLKNNLAVMPGLLLSTEKRKSKKAYFRVGLGGNFQKIVDGIKIFSETLLQKKVK